MRCNHITSCSSSPTRLSAPLLCSSVLRGQCPEELSFHLLTLGPLTLEPFHPSTSSSAAATILERLRDAGAITPSYLPYNMTATPTNTLTPGSFLANYGSVSKVPIADDVGRLLRTDLPVPDGPSPMRLPESNAPATAGKRKRSQVDEGLEREVHVYLLEVDDPDPEFESPERLDAIANGTAARHAKRMPDVEAQRVVMDRNAMDIAALRRVGVLLPGRLSETELESAAASLMLPTGTSVRARLRHVSSGVLPRDSPALRAALAMHVAVMSPAGSTPLECLKPASIALELMHGADGASEVPEDLWGTPGARWYAVCVLAEPSSAPALITPETAIDLDATRHMAHGTARLRHHLAKHRLAVAVAEEEFEILMGQFERKFGSHLSEGAPAGPPPDGHYVGAVLHVRHSPQHILMGLGPSAVRAGALVGFDRRGPDNGPQTYIDYFMSHWGTKAPEVLLMGPESTLTLTTARGFNRTLLHLPTGAPLRGSQGVARYPPFGLVPICDSAVCPLSLSLPPFFFHLEGNLTAHEAREHLLGIIREGAPEVDPEDVVPPVPLLREATAATGAQLDMSMERLELLGDALLKVTVCSSLFMSLPSYNEGILAHLKGQIVSNEELAGRSVALGLSRFLWACPLKVESRVARPWTLPCIPGLSTRPETPDIYARGGSSTFHINVRSKSIADIFEAVLGAFFAHGGYTAAAAFLRVTKLMPDRVLKGSAAGEGGEGGQWSRGAGEGMGEGEGEEGKEEGTRDGDRDGRGGLQDVMGTWELGTLPIREEARVTLEELIAAQESRGLVAPRALQRIWEGDGYGEGEAREAREREMVEWAERNLDYRFRDVAILRRALTHCSNQALPSNQTLEFLVSRDWC